MAQSTATVFVTETFTSYRPQTIDNVVTSFVPLASTFTPDPDCSTGDFHNNNAEQFDSVLVAYDPSFWYYIGTRSVPCVATEVVDWYKYRTVTTDTTASAQTTTSLPTVVSLMPVTCPDGWYTARTSTERPTMMQVTCCPSGYSVDPSEDHSVEANCDSTLDPGESIWYYPPTGDGFQTSFTATLHVFAVAVKGYMPLTTTSSTSSVTSTIAPGPSPITTTSTPMPASLTSYLPSAPTNPNTTDSQTSSSSSHTSGGTIAGAVIGSLAGVGLIGLGAFMFFRRRKAMQTEENDETKNEPSIPPSVPTLYDYSVVSQSEPGDRSTVVSEMPTLSNTPELFSDHGPTSPRSHIESYELE